MEDPPASLTFSITRQMLDKFFETFERNIIYLIKRILLFFTFISL